MTDDRKNSRSGPMPEDLQILEDLLASVRDVVWITAADGSRFLFINDATELVYGHPRKAFMNNPWLWRDVVHPDDQDRVRRESERLGRELSSLELEYRVTHPDGGVRWVRDRKIVIRDEEGQVVRLGGIAADITASKDAEELLRGQHQQLELDFGQRTQELRRAERKYRSLFEKAGVPIYSVTPEGKIAALNESWERVTGHPRQEWIGKAFHPLVHPDDLPRTLEHFENALAGKPQVFETRYKAASGKYRLAEHTLAPQLDPDDVVTEVVGIARDITARRETQRQRRQFEEQLQQIQKLESLGLLAGGIAHDFNNLLMGVLGEADLALEDLPEGAALRRPLETIRATAEQLATMANQMLAYSGRGRFKVVRTDLSKVVEEMVALMRASLSKKVTVECDFPGKPLHLEADISQLQQVVMNLVTNAAEAMDEDGGHVKIRTGETHLHRVQSLSGWPGEPLAPGRYLVLEVSDAGAGMDRPTQQRLFEPFFTSKATGRGLGLAAVLGIVRGHRGAIEVESQPGRGSTLRVLFRPADAPSATPSPKPSEPPASTMSGDGLVLVVDDESIARKVAHSILSKSGYDVLTADGGQRALDLLETHSDVNLVILDLTMPGLDGPNTFRKIRHRWPELRVIITSGYDQGQIPREMRSCAFLQKPYRAGTLIETVCQVLSPNDQTKDPGFSPS